MERCNIQFLLLTHLASQNQHERLSVRNVGWLLGLVLLESCLEMQFSKYINKVHSQFIEIDCLIPVFTCFVDGTAIVARILLTFVVWFDISNKHISSEKSDICGWTFKIIRHEGYIW